MKWVWYYQFLAKFSRYNYQMQMLQVAFSLSLQAALQPEFNASERIVLERTELLIGLTAVLIRDSHQQNSLCKYCKRCMVLS